LWHSLREVAQGFGQAIARPVRNRADPQFAQREAPLLARRTGSLNPALARRALAGPLAQPRAAVRWLSGRPSRRRSRATAARVLVVRSRRIASASQSCPKRRSGNCFCDHRQDRRNASAINAMSGVPQGHQSGPAAGQWRWGRPHAAGAPDVL
jgi:hypothetical protein